MSRRNRSCTAPEERVGTGMSAVPRCGHNRLGPSSKLGGSGAPVRTVQLLHWPAVPRRAIMPGKHVRDNRRCYAGHCDPYRCGGNLLRQVRCCAGADFNSKRNDSFHRTFHPPHFNHDQLHDVLQRAGGKLSNKLFGSLTAHGDARRNHNLERDCEHGLHDGLHFESARLSDQLRAGFSFAVGEIRNSMLFVDRCHQRLS